MKKGFCVLMVLLLMLGLLGGCFASTEEKAGDWKNLTEKQEPLLTALRAIEMIKAKDWPQLASLVHPEAGLRFSPYPHVEKDKDRVFTVQQVAALANDNTQYDWGVYDGSGEPIRLTYDDYYQRFIYDRDFALAPMIARDKVIGHGNAIENVQQIYPQGHFVEFHYPGSEEHDGIDWRSLKLVFEQQGDTWYLVAIIHGEWTI